MKVKVNPVGMTLFNYIQSELIKKGLNEFVDKDGNLLFFEEEHQFLTKILNYDTDVSSIVDRLFTGTSLTLYDHDMHFKKAFTLRFINREINMQTVESFRMKLLTTFLSSQSYINSVYADLDKYLIGLSESEQTSEQKNRQSSDATSTTDDRSAFANLPQNNVQLDVNSTIMTTANDNTISRNKQQSENNSLTDSSSQNTSTSHTYNLDNLIKSGGLLEGIYNDFDRKCFKQVW